MTELALSGIVLLLLLAGLNLAVLLRRPAGADRLLVLAEQALSLQRAEAETTRTQLAATERALAAALGTLSSAMMRDQGDARVLLETKLREMGEGAAAAQRTLSDTLGALSTVMLRDQGEARALLETKLREMSEQAALRLGAIQAAVNETLAETVEKQMQGSFQRVIDQFGQVQKAMTDVQAVTAQIGDLKRIFTSVKQRGTWGETHLRALLEDVFPQGGWESNRRVREGSDEVVEFALVMPVRGGQRPLLAMDAKFPAEDYDRLLLAAEAGDAEGERAARRGLETRLRQEARKIGEKYVNPPVTVDFAVMYLPTDGLYVEAARMPGLIESMNREHRVLVMGPSLAPALLRTILLGTLTLSIEQRAHDIQNLLGAVRSEMGKMDQVLAKLAGNTEKMSKSVEDARRRTRVMSSKLRSVTVLEAGQADAILELEAAEVEEEPAT